MCWTRTAERQISRMRMEYLKSVLRQEAGFFDSNQAAASTFLIVSSITSDCHSIQDTIAEKVLNFSLIKPFHSSFYLLHQPNLDFHFVLDTKLSGSHLRLYLLHSCCICALMAACFGCPSILFDFYYSRGWIWEGL